MKHVMIPFAVRADEIQQTRSLIRAFIAAIEAAEPDTLYYRSYEEAERPGHFVHCMGFKNEEAQAFHRETEHCQAFVEALYPLCIQALEATEYKEVLP